MKKYDVTYFEGKQLKVTRVYTDRPEDEIKAWFESHYGATTVRVSEADTSDEQSGAMIVRL